MFIFGFDLIQLFDLDLWNCQKMDGLHTVSRSVNKTWQVGSCKPGDVDSYAGIIHKDKESLDVSVSAISMRCADMYYLLVICYIANWTITMFNGNLLFQWPFFKAILT